MSNKNAAFLFDLDGVIFNSEKYYTEFWDAQQRKYLPEMKNFSDKIKGHGLNDIFNEYFSGKDDIQKLITEDLNTMENNMEFEYIAGSPEFLKQLFENNQKMCLVTSSKRNKMEKLFKKRPEIPEFFPFMVTASDVKHAKPAPDCYLKGAELLNIEPKDCIVFEDSLAGMISAHSAGMKVVALATTFDKKDIKGYAEIIINDFRGLNFRNLINDLL